MNPLEIDQNIIKKIKCALEYYYKIPENDLLDLISLCEIVKYKKNQIIKSYHSLETHIRLIISGCVGYFIENKNNDQCFYFAFENDFAVDYPNFISSEVRKIKLVALAQTELIAIHKNDFYNFCSNNLNGENLKNAALEDLYLDTQKEYFDLLTLNATQRYLKLFEKNKDVAQRIDHKHIASYLGITPQSLSRLRKNLLSGLKP